MTLSWNNNEECPVAGMLTQQLRLTGRKVYRSRTNWEWGRGGAGEGEHPVPSCTDELGESGVLCMSPWLGSYHMLNPVHWVPVDHFIQFLLILPTVAWLDMSKHCTVVEQSNVMVLLTSFLLSACNLDFSNTFISNLLVTSVFFLSNFLFLQSNDIFRLECKKNSTW